MKEINLLEWNKWFAKYVKPVFEVEERDKYYQKIKEIQTPFYPKFWIAEKFYDTIKNDDRFDEELKLFFSFLYSCGFFMENIITFEQWLDVRNWENPNIPNENTTTILELLSMPNGINLLKERLRWLDFINQR